MKSLLLACLMGLALAVGRDTMYIAFCHDMTHAAVDFAAQHNIGKIFLTQAVLTYNTTEAIEEFTTYATSKDVEVHFWLYVFHTTADGWVNPIDTSTQTYKTSLFNEIIARGKKGAALKNIKGIHMDYVRYPGTAYKYNYGDVTGVNAVSTFVKQAAEAFHALPGNLTVSAAIMPEKSDGIKYYGQDVTVLGKYVDVLAPMAYKGNYNSNTAWIVSTCQWYVSKGAPAETWCILQSYKSDDDPTPLSASAMQADVDACINGGIPAVGFFRYGLLKL